ncbi:MAG: hypothetical protein QOG98_1349 [Pseudonocardiales bacterium]|nr:hypothetical protein [Pseudonocardiales bacterium]
MTAQLHLVDTDLAEVPAAPAAQVPAQPLFGAPVYYVGADSNAISELGVEDLFAHRRRFGHRPHLTGAAGAAFIDTLEDIGLTGRGGGHFPVARKWRTVRTAGRNAVVVANGAEGEPLSGKDAALLQLRPHLVLDGLACAAEALDATDAVIWLHEGAEATRASIVHALAERRAAGLIEPQMRVVTGPARYLSGESSAIVQALSGGPALPQFRLASAATSGVNGLPTLVQNVETLARVALSAHSPEAFATSTLVTVAVPGRRVVLELDRATQLGDAIGSVLGSTPLQAILIGGYGGSWAPWVDVSDVMLAESDMRDRGLSLGAGILVPLGAGQCGLEQTASIISYLADSSARQCGPCVFGLRGVADLVRDLAEKSSGRRDLPRLQRFLAEINGRGGCHHPDGAVRMVASAVTTFAADISAHLAGRCLHDGAAHLGQRRG